MHWPLYPWLSLINIFIRFNAFEIHECKLVRVVKYISSYYMLYFVKQLRCTIIVRWTVVPIPIVELLYVTAVGLRLSKMTIPQVFTDSKHSEAILWKKLMGSHTCDWTTATVLLVWNQALLILFWQLTTYCFISPLVIFNLSTEKNALNLWWLSE